MCCVILTLTYFRVEPPESIWTPCNLLVLILILSECKQAELSADFLSDFANFMSVLYFSACARPSGILYYIFLLVERDLVFCVIYFPDFLFILCCIIPTLISLSLFFFSACLKLSLIYALFTCGILCYIFLRLKRAWYFETFGYIFSACVVFVMYTCYYKDKKTSEKQENICCIFPWVERYLIFCVIWFRMWNALWYIVLYVSTCGMCSGILCYIFPHVECALVFFVIFSTCGTLSGIFSFIFMRVECVLVLCVIYYCMWNALCFLCCIFPRVEYALVLWIYVLYFSTCGTLFGILCYIFSCFSLHFVLNYTYLDFP